MSFETLQIFSIVSYILAAIMFVFAVVLFFVLRVPKLFGYITGLNARKAIANIHSQNENDEDNVYNSNSVSKKDKYTSINNQARRNNSLDTSVGTEKLNNISSNSAENIHSDKRDKSFDKYNPSIGETAVLTERSYGTDTTILNENSKSDFIFIIEDELGFLGSSEFIE